MLTSLSLVGTSKLSVLLRLTHSFYCYAIGIASELVAVATIITYWTTKVSQEYFRT